MFPPACRKFAVLLALLAVLFLPMAAAATMVPVPLDINGTATNTLTSPSGVIATSDWNGTFSIESTVTRLVDNQGFYVYKYDYYATVPGKDFSHIIIGVSDPSPENNFWLGTVNDHTTYLTPDSYGDEGNSNPGIPSNLWGIKFDLSGSPSTVADLSFYSYSAPVWQDFYAKDGADNSGPTKIDVYAYNTGFGQTITPYDTNYIIGPDSVGGHVPGAPIPPSALLVGSGLLGMGVLSWRRKRG